MTIIILSAVSMNVQAAIRCTIGNVGYTKMQQAINAAKPGDVIVLKENVTTNYTMKIDKKKPLLRHCQTNSKAPMSIRRH